jgi:hypothetical protein
VVAVVKARLQLLVAMVAKAPLQCLQLLEVLEAMMKHTTTDPSQKMWHLVRCPHIHPFPHMLLPSLRASDASKE